ENVGGRPKRTFQRPQDATEFREIQRQSLENSQGAFHTHESIPTGDGGARTGHTPWRAPNTALSGPGRAARAARASSALHRLRPCATRGRARELRTRAPGALPRADS